MKCPICNEDMMPNDKMNLYVAEDCESSQEVFEGNIIWYTCLNKHNVYLETGQVPSNPTHH